MNVHPALTVLGLVALLLVAPLFAPYDPLSTSSTALEPPTVAHLLGTDRLGRDVLSRVLHGGQRTMGIAALATVVAVLPGLLLGLLAGTGGKTADNVISTLLNALLAFPGLLLALAIVTLLGAGPGSIAFATGCALIAPYARLTRAAVLTVRGMPYVEAARSLGAGSGRVVWRHLLPNIGPPLLAFAGVTFGYSVLNSAALSFLGMSGDLSIPDWGTMLYDARVTFRAAPWTSIAPGIAITTLVYLLNRLADRAMKSNK